MKTLSLILATLVFASIAIAQERSTDETAFESMIAAGNASVRWSGRKHRMTVTSSSTMSGRPQTDWSSRIVIEYGSNSDVSSVSDSSFGGKANPTARSLRIGDALYTRTGDKPWGRSTKSPAPSSELKRDERETTVSNLVYRWLGSEVYRNVSMVKYEKTSLRTSVDKKTGSKTDSEVTETFWVDSDGVVVKREYRAKSFGAAYVGQTHIVTEWELDPTIVVVPPEIGS